MRDERVYATAPRQRTTSVIEINLPEWYDRALCAQTDPEGFYPEAGQGSRTAKRVCDQCEVRPKCLAWALEHDERHGVWGGKTRSERMALMKERSA